MTLKIFSAENVIDCFKFWFKLANVLGVSSHKIIDHQTIKISYLGIVSFIIFVLNLIYYFWYYLERVSIATFRNLTVSTADITIFLILLLGFLVGHVVYSKDCCRLIQEIYKIDELFKAINIKFSYGHFKQSFILMLILSFLILETWRVINMLLVFQELWVIKSSYIQFFHTLFDVYRSFVLIKSHVILKILKDHFYVINRQLMEKNKPSVVDRLRDCHDKICDLCEILNTIEAVPMMCLLGSSFFLIISNSYYAYNAWWNDLINSSTELINAITVSTRYVVFALFLIPGFVGVEKEANETGKIVHKIIGRSGDSQTDYQVSDIFIILHYYYVVVYAQKLIF